MSRPGCNPGQRPTRPQGGRFSPTLGPGAALVFALRRCTRPARIGGFGSDCPPTGTESVCSRLFFRQIRLRANAIRVSLTILTYFSKFIQIQILNPMPTRGHPLVRTSPPPYSSGRRIITPTAPAAASSSFIDIGIVSPRAHEPARWSYQRENGCPLCPVAIIITEPSGSAKS